LKKTSKCFATTKYFATTIRQHGFNDQRLRVEYVKQHGKRLAGVRDIENSSNKANFNEPRVYAIASSTTSSG